MLEALRILSRQLGADLDLVQGAGGNTSVKCGDRIWVKASGTQLVNAEQDAIFTALKLNACREQIASGQPHKLANCIDMTVGRSQLRPSIETALHVLMPNRVVAHVHALNTIAASLQPELDAAMAEALSGLKWIRLPYVMPGAPLADSVGQALAGEAADIVILENHGLVVGGETTEEVSERIYDVERRLSPLMHDPDELAPVPAADTTRLTAEGFTTLEDEAITRLAFDDRALMAASAGTLYPDHVVFLGPSIAVTETGEPLPAAAERCLARRGVMQRLIVVPRVGVALQGEVGPAQLTMAKCLALLARRIRHTENLRTLSRSDEDALINWEAERYRQKLGQQTDPTRVE